MKKLVSLSNINKPTSPKWLKVGSVFLAISTFIGGYSITMTLPIAGYIGLGFGVIGTVLMAFKD